MAQPTMTNCLTAASGETPLQLATTPKEDETTPRVLRSFTRTLSAEMYENFEVMGIRKKHPCAAKPISPAMIVSSESTEPSPEAVAWRSTNVMIKTLRSGKRVTGAKKLCSPIIIERPNSDDVFNLKGACMKKSGARSPGAGAIKRCGSSSERFCPYGTMRRGSINHIGTSPLCEQ